jgi:hypothetical protein
MSLMKILTHRFRKRKNLKFKTKYSGNSQSYEWQEEDN